MFNILLRPFVPKMVKYCFTALIMVCGITNIIAQNVSGIVLDGQTGEAVIGATVMVKNWL